MNMLENPQKWLAAAITLWDGHCSLTGMGDDADEETCTVTADAVYLCASDGTPLAKYVLTPKGTLEGQAWSDDLPFYHDAITRLEVIAGRLRLALEEVE